MTLRRCHWDSPPFSLAHTAAFSTALCALLNLVACRFLEPPVSPPTQTHRDGTWEEELGSLCCTICCKILNLGKFFFSL